MVTTEDLISQAKTAASFAYVPYSNFPVGASLLTKDGQVYRGCNIENASFGLTNCAERTAIFNAVAQGKREFAQLVIFGNTDQPIAPCGACRQVMSEFMSSDTPVVLVGRDENERHTTVGQLLPYAFSDLS
ncbi:cytidine deaminase [Streptococcus sp. DD12]|uniref:cytidine deaminase n=1 Tax=Streptococcus sp. DD12 TaxID=1777880 RepID=UPI00079389DA|nr:cytidine deaminase [Streptococcus sp. DD12]KXT76630.1 Cytidine deaminase [Streptococcus sp. DD12]